MIEKERLIELAESNSQRSIARICNCSQSTVKRLMKKYGIVAAKTKLDIPRAMIGEASELAIATQLMLHGYPVLKPINSQLRYDLVAEMDGSFKRIQCKTGFVGGNGSHIGYKLKSTGRKQLTTYGKSYVGDVDYFGVYVPELKKCYLIPVEDGGVLRLKERTSGHTKPPRWAKNYELT